MIPLAINLSANAFIKKNPPSFRACRIYGVEPYAYLKETLERLPTATYQTVHLLTPRASAAAQAAKVAEDR